MPEIRFSIVITSFNQREFIKDAVDSALSQRNADREIIVIDDASTDGSQHILRAYGDAIRLVCFETNQGAGAARNCGAALASGEYLVFLDGDDAFLPWALDVYERIIQTRKPKMIVAKLWQFGGMMPVVQPGDTPHSIQIVEYEDYIRKDRTATSSASALVIDRQSCQRAQGWSRDLWPMNDHDFALRLGDCGRTILILAPRTGFYRCHANNTVKNVPAYFPSLYKVIHNERSGKYPGGTQRRFQRSALIGGYVLTWASRAIKRGLYGDSLKLLIHARSMTLAALTRKLAVNLKRRQPCETIKM